MKDPHPECTLERVRELERQLADMAVHVLNLRGAIHEALRLYAGGREHGDILRAALKASPDPTPPPAAEPVTVTEQERAVLRAMAEIDTEVLEHIERGWSAAHPIWHPPALAELALRRAAAREGK